ncbi:unnamed protein product [Zymoseptoria tritici ST99CH_1A5]|uniref:Ubiquitin carboxyl-terminal hydrolase n=3 Tax=Zymoseptoria tritici TaxID=1047171 RepID=A0A1X7S668_ZYMT9|nr:unnamed protein product [Zymoseptoria tritici ST99CH_3D7]SMR60379.1 unnamed protein product [Zymoseptoria tritici ST99CH_1E4]SMR63491.1 unnamed protein product [Zymoseptoria tritici ST99CH_3D1]SMY28836.1 unnamed protein product [Zymoseptoria tritici ST99CH_1A5]
MASSATGTPTSATTDAPKLLKKASSKGNVPVQRVYGCPHIKNLLAAAGDKAIDGYTKLITTLQKEGNVTDRITKGPSGISTCGHVTYLCLQCPTVSASKEKHRPGHNFAVESSNGFVLCYDCKDFVYDPTFEEIRAPNTKKRKYSTSVADGDRKLMANNAVVTPCAATGLRGLYNMGQTCFMSVILQSLIHNPFIRTFYLAEGHRSTDCEREACTSCALDDMFIDFYAQEKHEGYGAVHMLQGCWKGGGGLAGYSQQDAHEYLGFILNSLHEANIDEDDERPAEQKEKDCECVIHQTFGGLLRSTVTCATCNNVTTSLDPFMDLSLDVKNAGFSIKKKKLAMINGTQTVKEALPMDLTECLERFTSVESLSTDSYFCRKCEASREAKKKLTIARLPPVVPIHLKRFSHSQKSSQSNKVDTRVRFPFTLDLSPYVISDTTNKSSTNGHKVEKPAAPADDDEDTIDVKTPSKNKLKGDAEPQEPIYELSSVIVHKGKIDNGHYISYSRQGAEWFRFDDSMVVQVDEKEVLGAEAYMLFYVVSEF